MPRPDFKSMAGTMPAAVVAGRKKGRRQLPTATLATIF